MDSVINPRQKTFAWVINEYIIKVGLEITGWELKFEDINISDLERDSKIHSTYFNIGAMNANEIRKELGLDPYDQGNKFYINGSLVDVTAEEEEPMPTDNANDAGGDEDAE